MPKKTTSKTSTKTTSKAKKTTRKKEKVKETTKVEHVLVPEHIKLSEREKEKLFKNFNVSLKEMPKISIHDAAIRHLDPQENDVIKILRKSPTAGTSVFYRGVINE